MDEAKKAPHRIYAVIVESADQWHIAMLGVPVGTAMEAIRLMAETNLARDEEVPPDAKIRLVMPIEPLLESMESFRELLTKMGAKEQPIV
jgi:hypothetical protein